MARRKSNKQALSPSANRKRIENARDGRGKNQAYTSGARAVGFKNNSTGEMVDAHAKREKVQTYTSSKRGRMSDGTKCKAGNNIASCRTWTMTEKDSDGNKINQSGRSSVATRRQRYYDETVGLGLAGG